VDLGAAGPDLFNAVALLSVPYRPPGARRPTQAFAELVGPDNEFYMNYFQEPGRVEGEAEADVRRWLEGFYYGASADALSGRDAGMWITPKGDRMVDRLPRLDTPLAWLPKVDLDVYAGEFERTGVRGGLNRYRNLDRDSDDLAALRGQPLRVPALFFGGDKDGPTVWGSSAIARSPRCCRFSKAATSSRTAAAGSSRRRPTKSIACSWTSSRRCGRSE
jgi:hypothetical protein